MQNTYNDTEIEDKLLNNSLLFNSIHKNKTSEDKIKKIKKYLEKGADINAKDANFKNNTPLHVAVIKEEPEVVSFLLERGALINNKNSDGKTVLDIARQYDKPTDEREKIVNILEAFNRNKLKHSKSINANFTKKIDLEHLQSVPRDTENQSQSSDVRNGSAVKNRKVMHSKSYPQQLKKQLKTPDVNETFRYQKRTGTSGLSGQLYETKLLSLILFRALYVYEIKAFLIATNVDCMGAFDDIVFRFSSNKSDRTRIIFVQAKHRDNPAKDKFTVDDIMKLNGDFSLHKYLESYIKISQMFEPENNDDMFRGEFKNMDCQFIIYTSAHEKFSKKKPVKPTEVHFFMKTSQDENEHGHNIQTEIAKHAFQFDYDDQDVELLVQSVAKSRAELLAKRLTKFIFKDNHSNMMMDDLIKTYHVFLARNILEIEMKEGESQNNFRIAKFRESFFSSNDYLLLAFKASICKEVSLMKKIISPEKVESILMSLSFKVPLNFGNLKFCFGGSEQKKGKKLEYLCLVFKQIFAKANISANIVMKVDDNMVGPNEMLQSTDLESYRLGGLVGNLLVFDDVTKTLKFNFDVDTLSEDNIKLLEKLKTDVFVEIDLRKCRFDINVSRFPRLSLIHDEYDKKLIKDFLGKLIFYTNQATEDIVEKILKEEIDKYFVGSVPRQSDPLFSVKSDAIFLKVHDHVQKWWKLPINAPYLTESCMYFTKAEQDILNSPLLSILNFNYTETIKNSLPAFKFKEAALELLQLNAFLAGAPKILSIITEENALSSIKIIQHFKERNFNDYTFIDLDYVGIGNYFVDVKTEIQISKIKTLIIVCKSHDVIPNIHLLIKHFGGKIIIISNRDLANQINGIGSENIVERVDSQTGFKDLADAMRTMLLKERYIVFQGKEVPLGTFFADESYHLINSKLLYMIINNEKISIGSFFNNPAYDEVFDFYINEQVCRYITLDPNVVAVNELNILKFNDIGDDFIPDTRDIVLITDKLVEFVEFVNTHVHCNVHWFTFKDNECLIWKKSRGSITNILKYVCRSSHCSHIFQPKTLKDVPENVVIVSAEPGMGKSLLLTHLAINTKHKYPALWISKINLLENTKEFKRMQENNVTIDFKEAVQFLFRVIGFEAYKKSKAKSENLINQVSVTGDDILFNKNEAELNLTGLNLFEIELFIHCYNNNRVALLFDGFDEICPDYTIEFLKLVNIFKKSKVVHLWVTSRLYNVLHQLENTLETFSFTILPLTYEDQLQFLEKIWLSKGSNPMLSYFPFNTKMGLQKAVKGFLEVLSAVLCDSNYKFISMPLHLYMISEIFQDSFHKFPLRPESMERFICSQDTMNRVNLNQLYERFVDVKFFRIRFGEKKPLLCINDPDIRKLIDNERSAFFKSHKLIAAYVIFGKIDELELFDSHDISEIRDFVKRIKAGEEKTGIIEQIIKNEPKFVHYTFAEYFATEFLCDRLKSFHNETSLWTYFIETFLQSEEGGPRRFFNARLGNHPLKLSEIYNSSVNILFKKLLTKHHLKLAKLIFRAIDEYLENIAVFLLDCVKPVLTKKNLDDFIDVVTNNFNESCIVCIAAERCAAKVITFIINVIKGIDVKRLIDLYNCSDLPAYNAVLVAYGAVKGLFPNEWMLHILLSDLPSSAIVKLFCMQFDSKCYNKIEEREKKSKKLIHIIWCSLGDTTFPCFDIVLEKLNKKELATIFGARDSDMKLAAHIAASREHYTFFDRLESLLDRSQFKEICLTRDKTGLTPMHYFKYTKKDCDKLKTLLDKVYDDNTDEKLTLKYFIDK